MSSTTLNLVLDTNVELDWLVFNDPAMRSLTTAVRNSVILHGHTTTLYELRRVLSYPALKLDANQQAAILRQYQALTKPVALPSEFSPQNLLTPAGFPRCRDRDDQIFLALALHTHADALVSRDKAVLALRKRAARFGVKILDVTQMQRMMSNSTSY